MGPVSDVLLESCRSGVEGDFVRLRPLVPDDAERTLAWRSGPRASLLHPGASTVEGQRAWIAGRPADELNYVIETRAGVPLGMVSLIDIDFLNRHAEVARLLIGEEEAARGLPAAVEAMKLVYGLAFERLGLLRIYGTVAEDNTLMIKWHRYLGMKDEGRLRKHALINGRFQDLLYLGMLEPEYRRTALPRMKGLIAMAGQPLAAKDAR